MKMDSHENFALSLFKIDNVFPGDANATGFPADMVSFLKREFLFSRCCSLES